MTGVIEVVEFLLDVNSSNNLGNPEGSPLGALTDVIEAIRLVMKE